MNWIIPALLAPAVYALVVFIDKYLLSKQIKDYRGMPIFAAIAGVVSGSLIWLFSGRVVLPMSDGLIVLSTGVLTAISFAAYYKAIANEEASNINLLFQMFPVIVLVLSALFLGEFITFRQIIGFVLIMSAVIVSSVKINLRMSGFRLSKSFILILFYDLLLAISAILMKSSMSEHPLINILPYQGWGVGVGGFILFMWSSEIRGAFMKTFSKIKKVGLGLIFLNEIIFIFARTLTYFAFSLGSTALVSVLEGAQVFFGVLYGILATKLLPKFISEDISNVSLTRKIALAIVLFLGVWLIYA